MSGVSAPSASPPNPNAEYPYYGGFGPRLVGEIWALFAISTILMILRVWVRLTMVKHEGGWSLFWALIAYALAVPSNVLYDLAAHYGLGNHTELVLTDAKLPTALLFEWIAACTISFSAWFGRVSAASFIFSVQGRTNPYGKWLVIGMLAIMLIDYIVTVPMIFTQCTPARKLWEQTIPYGNCDGVDRAFKWAVWTGAWSVVADLVLALYPTWIVYQLQVKLRLKLVLCSLMGVGIFAAIASAIKTSQFGRLRTSIDPIYEIAPLMMWGSIEMWLILIAASVAPLWPLVHKASQVAKTGLSKASGFRSTQQSRHRGDETDESQHFSRLGSNDGSRNATKLSGIEMRTEISTKEEDYSSLDRRTHTPTLGINENKYGRSVTEVRAS